MDERLKEFYKSYPDKFIEDFLDVQLFPYQKLLIRNIISNRSEEKS